jgi:hypothetical protein
MPKLGKSVALVTPREERGRDRRCCRRSRKGRLLIYWGCGEHAPKGQPVVIDFARVAAGQVPPGVFSSSVMRDWGPTIGQQPHLRPLAGGGRQVREVRQLR